ncbi:unnamed protein product [Microthlaspi erraticum]|uniref:Arabidopsis retrotransposon Orf1 C-terminal domain-containing protein n=1 Tax=Microthlaspi erraticum TaxID=1685480 RepID=A0A6D2KUK4_9BRAS|nr:unnamed protein product [Microthlaspi erraticum]
MRMICEKRSLNSIELRIELRTKSSDEDLGEPECYYFEEYEAPRMNPSVVAAHKRIGLLQKFNKWQGKAMRKMQKSMDKMVSKIKSLEKKVSGSSSKKKKSMAPTFPRSRSFSPLQGGSLPKSLFISSQGKEKTTRRGGGRVPRPDAPARPGLDRVQTEETQLDRAEGRVDLREFENPGFEYDPTQYQDFPRATGPIRQFEQASSSKAKGATHFEMKKKRSRKLDRAHEPSAWSAPDGRPISRPRPSLPVLWGALRLSLGVPTRARSSWV